MGTKPSRYETLEFNNNEFKVNISDYTQFPIPPLKNCILKLDNNGIHLTHNDIHICSISWYRINKWSTCKKKLTFCVTDNDIIFDETKEYNLELINNNNNARNIYDLAYEITKGIAEKNKINSEETDKVNINLEI